MKRLERSLLLSIVTLAVAATLVRADEGRVPISQPTIITQPGSYVLTRDIDVTTGDAIVIDASDVDLDLNGRTIQSADAAGFVIRIDATTTVSGSGTDDSRAAWGSGLRRRGR